MEDELSHNRSAFATPSVDPLDTVLAKMETERASGSQGAARSGASGQEPEKDEATSTVTTAEGTPEDDDLEYDDDVEETKTPTSDVEDDDDESLEPQQTKSPASSTPDDKNKQAKGTDSEDDDKPLSRKERGKIIQELRRDLETEQEQKRELEESLKQQREEDERLSREVDRALGTQAEYDKAMEDGLAGDEEAGKKARIWKANREFYKKLLSKAERDNATQFMSTYWQEVNGLPGVTQDALKAPSLSTILKNMYDAGVSSVKDTSSTEIEKLKADVDTWRGRYRSLKAKAGGTRQSPLGGGGSTATETAFDWRKKYTDPNGMLTDEAEAIVAAHGFEALKNPNFKRVR